MVTIGAARRAFYQSHCGAWDPRTPRYESLYFLPQLLRLAAAAFAFEHLLLRAVAAPGALAAALRGGGFALLGCGGALLLELLDKPEQGESAVRMLGAWLAGVPARAGGRAGRFD